MKRVIIATSKVAVNNRWGSKCKMLRMCLVNSKHYGNTITPIRKTNGTRGIFITASYCLKVRGVVPLLSKQ